MIFKFFFFLKKKQIGGPLPPSPSLAPSLSGHNIREYATYIDEKKNKFNALKISILIFNALTFFVFKMRFSKNFTLKMKKINFIL